MGNGVSVTEKAELQRSYAAWGQATAGGPISDADFLALLAKEAPGLHAKAVADGSSGLAAAQSLQSQFTTAQRKMALRKTGSSERLAVPATTTAPAAASTSSDGLRPLSGLKPSPLQRLYSWSSDKQTNLQRGLASGMLKSEPLRLAQLTIGEGRVLALVDTGAEHCAMSPAAAERCGLSPLVDESFGGMAGGIGTTAKRGRVHYAKMTLGDAKHQFEAAFDVMSWPPAAGFEAILGIDFLARYRAQLDIVGNTMQLVAALGADAVKVELKAEG